MSTIGSLNLKRHWGDWLMCVACGVGGFVRVSFCCMCIVYTCVCVCVCVYLFVWVRVRTCIFVHVSPVTWPDMYIVLWLVSMCAYLCVTCTRVLYYITIGSKCSLIIRLPIQACHFSKMPLFKNEKWGHFLGSLIQFMLGLIWDLILFKNFCAKKLITKKIWMIITYTN